MKLKFNTKLSIILIVSAISVYFLVDIGGVDFAFLAPVYFENIKMKVAIDSATISATTSNPIICAIQYGKNGEFTNLATDNEMDIPHKEHSVELVDLEPSTKYNFKFVGTFENKQVNSEIKTFLTSPPEIFSTPVSNYDFEG